MKVTLSFGPFRLTPAARLLEKNGVQVNLGARALELLIALVERAGEVVNKQELAARGWPGVNVDDGSIRFHMTALRKSLDDGKDGSRYISTISGRGYCFVEAVITDIPEIALNKERISIAKATRLPAQLSKIIGREGSVLDLCSQVKSHRLVTIVGTGGLGKTTVAVSVGHVLFEEFDGKVCLVDLGPVSNPGLVTGTLASTLGIVIQSGDPLPALIGYLRQSRMLVIFDGCEHVIDAVASLTEAILQETAEVHILATSREAIRASGEIIYRLAPLDTPSETEGVTAAGVMSYPAVQLFIDRVVAADSAFALADTNAPIVAEVCRKLGGIALALELAAGRVAAYGVHETARLLGSQFSLHWPGRRAAPPRHQTLTATLDWSYDLLPGSEQIILRRIAIFAGYFTLEAVQALMEGEQQGLALDGMAGLVAKSLIIAKTTTIPTLYRLLDTTRAYAELKLAKSGERANIARRHAAFFTAFLQRPDAFSAEMFRAQSYALYADHLGNIRSALQWSFGLDGDIAAGRALAAAAVRLFLQLSLLPECRRWAEQAIASIDPSDKATNMLEELQLQASFGQSLMFTGGNMEDVRAALLRGLSLAQQLGNLTYQLQILGGLHLIHANSGRHEIAEDIARRSIQVAKSIGDPGGIAAANSFLGVSFCIAGNHAAAHSHLTTALSEERAAYGVRFGFDHRTQAYSVLARNLWLQGYPDQAATLVTIGLDQAESFERPVTLCIALAGAARVFLWNGAWRRAEDTIVRLCAEAEIHSLGSYSAAGTGFQGELSVREGNLHIGVTALRKALGVLRAKHFGVLSSSFMCALAEGLAAMGLHADAYTTADEVSTQVESGGITCMTPELLRVKGVILTASDPHGGEGLLLRSLAMAREHGARSLELRTATSLAKLLANQSRGNEGAALLAEVYAGFTEGFATIDLCVAKQLLEDIGGSGVVS